MDIPKWNVIDVDRIVNDDTIGSKRRVPLDVYGSGVQGTQNNIACGASPGAEHRLMFAGD